MQAFKEYKWTYAGELKIFDCSLVSQVAGEELVLLYKPERTVTFAGITFDKSSASFGYYWPQRNYNVYHWKDVNTAETMVYYFNVSKDTIVEKGRVEWLDLIVDILYIPGRSPVVLDEDEIPNDIEKPDLQLIEDSKSMILENLPEITGYLEKRTSDLIQKQNLFPRQTRS